MLNRDSDHDLPSADDPIEPLDQQLERLNANIGWWVAHHDRIARILRDFYMAKVSASSLQPILDLAVELNPGLGVKTVMDNAIIDVNNDENLPF